LNSDSAALTAGANDLGYDFVFARQVEAFGSDGDVFLGITTSGNSPNIVHALTEAKKKGMKTILLTGRSGGKIMSGHGESVDLVVRVPADETARIQESHILIGHIICSIVEKELFDLI
jgi:D-sedoheptulose 7-phosphate isomerase